MDYNYLQRGVNFCIKVMFFGTRLTVYLFLIMIAF